MIDNNNAGGYDYVIIKDYRTMVLAKSAGDKLVSMYNDGEGGKPFEVSLLDTDVVFYKDGYEATKYHIGEWDVLNVMMSKDKKAAVIEVSNGELAGVVENIKTNKEGKTIITVAGKEVEATDYFVEAYKRGDFTATEPKKSNTYFFALDGDGRIVGVKKNTGDKLEYGVLTGIARKSGLDDDFEVKIYGNYGAWIKAKLAQNVKVNGSRNVDFMTEVNALGDRGGKGIVQLIQYRLNNEGEVSEIYFAQDRRAEGYDHEVLSLDDANVPGKVWEQNSAMAMVWSATKADNPDRKEHFVDQSGTAPMFYVPYSRADEDFVFQLAYGNMGRYGTTNTDMEIYDVKRYSDEHDIDKIGAVIVYGNENGTAYNLNSLNSTGLSYNGNWIVQDVYETVDEAGDIRLGIDLKDISGGTNFSTYFADTVYNADVQGTYGYGNLRPEDLKFGDIVNITYDAPYSENPRINLFAVYMRKDDYADFSKKNVKYYYANIDGDIHEYWNQKSQWPNGCYCMGEVVYIDDYVMVVHSKDNQGGDLYFNLLGGSTTWEYSVERDEFAKSTYSVIGKGDRIAIQGNLNGYAPSWIIRVVEE